MFLYFIFQTMKKTHNHFSSSIVGLVLTAIFLLFVYPNFGWDERIINLYTSPDGSGFALKEMVFCMMMLKESRG